MRTCLSTVERKSNSHLPKALHSERWRYLRYFSQAPWYSTRCSQFDADVDSGDLSAADVADLVGTTAGLKLT